MRVTFLDQRGVLGNLKKLGFYPKTIFDVGVAKGTPWLYAAFPDSYYFLVEPVASFSSDIEEILKTKKGRHIQAALGAAPGKAHIYIPKDQGKHQISTLRFDWESVPNETKTEVDILTLDTIFHDYAETIVQPILLKTDCQGHDLEVVRGAIHSLESIDVVITEVPLYGPWGGGDELKDYLDFYYANNYILYDVVEPLRRPDDDRLHSIDLCLVNLKSPIGERGLYTDGRKTIEKSLKYYQGR